MTVEEREAFLAELHVGILAIDRPGRGPHALPIWYRYRSGTVEIGMSSESQKARLLTAAGRATLTVQTESPPYKYVSVEGPITVQPRDSGDLLEMASRYLGPETGRWYADSNPMTEASVLVVLTCETWLTADFSKATQ